LKTLGTMAPALPPFPPQLLQDAVYLAKGFMNYVVFIRKSERMGHICIWCNSVLVRAVPFETGGLKLNLANTIFVSSLVFSEISTGRLVNCFRKYLKGRGLNRFRKFTCQETCSYTTRDNLEICTAFGTV
jgi:hypothetical protein